MRYPRTRIRSLRSPALSALSATYPCLSASPRPTSPTFPQPAGGRSLTTSASCTFSNRVDSEHVLGRSEAGRFFEPDGQGEEARFGKEPKERIFRERREGL